jgi:hypothetical protein
MSWTPPPRPRWVERLIAHGDAVGGPERLVSLDGDALCEEAVGSTGLSDFGGDDWRAPFRLLLDALERESSLHLLGRLLARTELLRTLRNRLGLTELWRRRPEMLAAPIEAPVFIVGSPRSGTSILHELLALDPDTRSPAMWEMNHPVEAAEGGDLADLSDDVVQLWHDLQPEYETMHANSGHLPNECIFITMHSFVSDHWGGCHVVPSYDAFLARADHRPAFRYHADFLRTLQARGGPRRWLLKAPSHLSQLAALFAVYPDARIVRTHRDPLRTLPSTLSLLGTLKWMRCRRVDLRRTAPALAAGYAYLFRREMEARASGALPEERFVDVHYDALVRDPVGTVAAVSERLGRPLGDPVRRRVADYAARKPPGSRGVHRYSLEAVGLDAATERERYAFYTEHYGIAAEPA